MIIYMSHQSANSFQRKNSGQKEAQNQNNTIPTTLTLNPGLNSVNFN